MRGEGCESGWVGGGEGGEVESRELAGEGEGEGAVEGKGRDVVPRRAGGCGGRGEGVESALLEPWAPEIDELRQPRSYSASLHRDDLESFAAVLEKEVERRELEGRSEDLERLESKSRSSNICNRAKSLSYVSLRLWVAKPPPANALEVLSDDDEVAKPRPRGDEGGKSGVREVCVGGDCEGRKVGGEEGEGREKGGCCSASEAPNQLLPSSPAVALRTW